MEMMTMRKRWWRMLEAEFVTTTMGLRLRVRNLVIIVVINY
jgi:hypothetical protein